MGIKHRAVKATLDVGTATEWNDTHEIDSDTGFPTPEEEGELFYRSDLHVLYCWDGTIWQALF